MLYLVMILGLLATQPQGLPAQAYYCSRPSEPYILYGGYSERYQMESAQMDVDQYIDDMNDYIDCLARETEDARSEANNVLDEWNTAVRSYNSRF